MRKRLIALLLTLTSLSQTYATTWDEPWANKVIKESTSFVLAKVLSNDHQKGTTIQIYKTLGGKALTGTLTISDFYLLDICSSSGGGPEFHIEPMDSCYFFINESTAGKYRIATPTTGFDYVAEGSVMATYRHSYHQASVPTSIYEKTMTAIFNNYHGLPFDQVFKQSFIEEYLSKKPAGFEDHEINTFFLQHVALESIHHLKLNVDVSLILPFLKDKNNFHNQVSGARAMIVAKKPNDTEALMHIVGDTSQRYFVQVMCVWTLKALNPKELKQELQNLEKWASEESDDFGGNIMDPRVCTNIPTVKSALKDLIESL